MGPFSDWERNRLVGDTLGLGVLFSAMFSIVSLRAYLVLHFAFGLREGALVTALVITALPFSLMHITLWPGVIA